jgi:creatinine amidohydrolase
VQLNFSTWQEVELYLAKRRDIIIPIGATEQHGPHGLIGTDALCAEGLAIAAGRRIGVLVTPTVQVGMSLHHLGFPGSMSLSPGTLIAVVGDWVSSLAGHGFDRFHFVNGHGGNVATVQAAFPGIYSTHSEIRCLLTNWYELPKTEALVEQQFGENEGHHGTPSELSLSWHLHPEHCRATKPVDLSIGTDDVLYSAGDFRKRYPDGRMGSNQHLADPKIGKLLFEAAVEEIALKHERWLETP